MKQCFPFPKPPYIILMSMIFLDDPNPYFFLHYSQPSSNIPSPNPIPSPTGPHLPNGPTSSPHQQTPSFSSQNVGFSPVDSQPALIPLPIGPTSHGATPHLFSPSIPSSSPPLPSPPGVAKHSKHGIFKPNPKYTSQALSISFSSLPKNSIHALRDPN